MSEILSEMFAGVYGDVVRVKILYNKRDSALVQFKEPQQIHTGMCLLFTVINLYGNPSI